NHGYDPAETCTPDICDPAFLIGNIAAQAVIDARRYDGSNQYGDLPPAPCPLTPGLWPLPCAASAYAHTSDHPIPLPGEVWAYSDYDLGPLVYSPYVPTNPLMGYCNPLVDVCERQDIVDPNHWQPLIFSNGQECLDSRSGTEETCKGIQCFIAPHW